MFRAFVIIVFCHALAHAQIMRIDIAAAPPHLVDPVEEIPAGAPVNSSETLSTPADARPSDSKLPENSEGEQTEPVALVRPEDIDVTRPPTVDSFQRPYQWNMTLGEALFLALQNSPSIAIQSLVPELAETEVLQAKDRFDPQVEMNHHWSLTRSALASNIDTFGSGSNSQTVGAYGQSAGKPDQLAISKTLSTGANVRAGITTGYTDNSPTGAFTTLNPAWRTNVNLYFSQPLMRGFGPNVQYMPIRIARAYKHSTDFAFESIVLQLLRDVENQYWNLAFSHQNLEVRRKNVLEARKTYEKEIAKFNLGESSRPDLAEAKLHYYLMIDLYHMRKTELLEDQRAFRELVGLPGFDASLIHVALPEGQPEIDADWEWSVSVMLQSRPDLVSQRHTADSFKMKYQLARNENMPDLNLEGNFGKSGLDNRFDQSVGRIVDEDNYSWFMGLSHVRRVNNWKAQAEIRRAYISWQQQLKITEQLEFNAIHTLQRAYEQFYQKRNRVKQLQNVRAAAAERLAAYKEKFELGGIPIEIYLRAQADEADKELQHRYAKVELIQAASHFEFVRGTLLQARSVQIIGTEPDLSPAKDYERSILKMTDDSKSPLKANAPEFEDMLKLVNPEVRDRLLQDTLESDPMDSLQSDGEPQMLE